MESVWKWHVIPENLGFFASGFQLTLIIFALSWVGCWTFAVVFGAMRHSSRPWLSYPAAAVVEVIRGTPGLMFVVWVYFLSQPLIGYAMSPFWAAVWALLIHQGAHGAEVVRAGLNSVPRGQVAAGYSTGLSYVQVMARIVLPQALRNMAPAVVNRSVPCSRTRRSPSSSASSSSSARAPSSTAASTRPSRCSPSSPPSTSSAASRCRGWDSAWVSGRG